MRSFVRRVKDDPFFGDKSKSSDCSGGGVTKLILPIIKRARSWLFPGNYKRTNDIDNRLENDLRQG